MPSSWAFTFRSSSSMMAEKPPRPEARRPAATSLPGSRSLPPSAFFSKRLAPVFGKRWEVSIESTGTSFQTWMRGMLLMAAAATPPSWPAALAVEEAWASSWDWKWSTRRDEVDGAARLRQRQQLVAAVGGDLEADPGLVGEVHGQRRDQGDGDHHHQQGGPALAAPGAPAVSGGGHGQNSSGAVMATRAWVVNFSVRPSASFTSSSMRTRVGSSLSLSGVRVDHSRTHSLRFRSQ